MKKYEQRSSELLIDYREALLNAYYLGEMIKDIYGIIPPTSLIYESNPATGKRVSLNVH